MLHLWPSLSSIKIPSAHIHITICDLLFLKPVTCLPMLHRKIKKHRIHLKHTEKVQIALRNISGTCS